ncbi:MAG: hypothetical protein IT369_08695 [Candidatus Latescibacteria bacterium]|nr:hypothetical protein [Candidatus Latescibacterota bacterium]
MKYTLIVAASVAIATSVSAYPVSPKIGVARAHSGLAGSWQGAIQTPGGALQVALTLERSNSQGWRGMITMPQQGVQDMPMDMGTIEVQGDSMRFTLHDTAGDLFFLGVLSVDRQTLAGVLSVNRQIPTSAAAQAGTGLTFSVRRIDEAMVAALRQAKLAMPGAVLVADEHQRVIARRYTNDRLRNLLLERQP